MFLRLAPSNAIAIKRIPGSALRCSETNLRLPMAVSFYLGWRWLAEAEENLASTYVKK